MADEIEPGQQSEILGRLEKLRVMRADWGPEDGALMQNWERQIIKAAVYSDYANQETSQKLASLCERRIADINRSMAAEPVDLANPTAYALKQAAWQRERDVWRYFLIFYTRDYQKLIRSVGGEIDRELERQA